MSIALPDQSRPIVIDKDKTRNWFCTIGIKYSSRFLFDRPEIANILADVRFERRRRHDPEPRDIVAPRQKETCKSHTPNPWVSSCRRSQQSTKEYKKIDGYRVSRTYTQNERPNVGTHAPSILERSHGNRIASVGWLMVVTTIHCSLQISLFFARLSFGPWHLLRSLSITSASPGLKTACGSCAYTMERQRRMDM